MEDYSLELEILDSNLDNVTKIKLIQGIAVNKERKSYQPIQYFPVMPNSIKRDDYIDPYKVTCADNSPSSNLFDKDKSPFTSGNDMLSEKLRQQ